MASLERKDLNVVKIRLKERQEKTHRVVGRKGAEAGKKRCKGRLEKTRGQAKQVANENKEWHKGKQKTI
jgi:hypothetical protein